MKNNLLKNSLLVLALSLSLLALQTSCTKNKESNDQQTVDLGKHLVEEGQYSEAILVLSPYLQNHQDDREVRLVLASAYAGRAEVLVVGYIDFARELVRSAHDADRIFNNRQNYFSNLDDKLSRDLTTTIDAVYKTLWKLNDFIGAFEKIPTAKNSDAVQDLTSAIYLLSGDSNYVGGALLYRALLRISLLKYHINTKYYFTQTQPCVVDFQILKHQLTGIHDEISPILKDLADATIDSKQRSDLTEALSKLDTSLFDSINLVSQFEQGGRVNGRVNVSDFVRKIGGKCQ